MLSAPKDRPVALHFWLATAIALIAVAIGGVRMAIDADAAMALSNLSAQVYGGAGFMNLVTLAKATWFDRDLVIVFLFAAAPSLAAIVLSWRRGTLSALLTRLKPVGPDGTPLRAAQLYFALLVVYGIGLWLHDWVAGPGVDASVRLSSLSGSLIIGAALALFLDEGGTLEELGWRGYAWPLLLERMRSPLTAALFLGTLHWAWHLPREIIPLASGTPIATFFTLQAVFLLLCLALAIVAGYCVNLTGGSALPAIMVHGGSNVWAKAMGEYSSPSFGLFDLRTLILLLLASLILIFAGRRLGLAAR